MSDIAYLIVINWPFLLIALLIGVATGWYGAPDTKR